MSLQDEMTTVQRCLDELARSVTRLETHVGSGLEIRRMRSDTEHLRESLALLRASAPGASGPSDTPHREMVIVPDTPYDSSLWTDAEDEGLGAKDRHAP
ncbi:hypothetical protein LHJ74_18915 [Streptomyces sp. N2-109]|uniref:Uncharacterized protein n=1 Tax=Streptomyces gossypii TaxID=2883101 RepID=A0ABT2JVT3_9ACTN|nr:hypothetical protein [Streptomyces gossypii]MCT2591946.1 hypothetical protein [Streptomyces gossypii]